MMYLGFSADEYDETEELERLIQKGNLIMTNESKLKQTIRQEMDKVKDKIILINGKAPTETIYREWLQSLQRIDKVCKDRNRY